jgi:hypothetical protein
MTHFLFSGVLRFLSLKVVFSFQFSVADRDRPTENGKPFSNPPHIKSMFNFFQ